MNKVKEFRQKKGLKQKQVANEMGISTANYSKKENGSIKFSVDEGCMLAKILDARVEEIFLN